MTNGLTSVSRKSNSKHNSNLNKYIIYTYVYAYVYLYMHVFFRKSVSNKAHQHWWAPIATYPYIKGVLLVHDQRWRSVRSPATNRLCCCTSNQLDQQETWHRTLLRRHCHCALGRWLSDSRKNTLTCLDGLTDWLTDCQSLLVTRKAHLFS